MSDQEIQINILTPTSTRRDVPRNIQRLPSNSYDMFFDDNFIEEFTDFSLREDTDAPKGSYNLALKLSKFSDHSCRTCTVCHSDFSQGETVAVLPCNHLYHENCIRNWGIYRATCPLCRKDIPDREIT
jgi:hypothetical protein